MTYVAPVRNFNNIQFDRIRSILDDRFNTAHDELTSAYYDYWAKGISHPWRSFDAQPTPAESKVLFDKLHGLIFQLRMIAFHNANMTLPLAQRYSEDAYRYGRDRNGDILFDNLATAQTAISLLAAQGINLTVN
jgi:hypothetical protein